MVRYLNYEHKKQTDMTETGQQVQKCIRDGLQYMTVKLNLPMKPPTKPCWKFKGKSVEKEGSSGPYNKVDELK